MPATYPALPLQPNQPDHPATEEAHSGSTLHRSESRNWKRALPPSPHVQSSSHSGGQRRRRAEQAAGAGGSESKDHMTQWLRPACASRTSVLLSVTRQPRQNQSCTVPLVPGPEHPTHRWSEPWWAGPGTEFSQGHGTPWRSGGCPLHCATEPHTAPGCRQGALCLTGSDVPASAAQQLVTLGESPEFSVPHSGTG